MNFGKFKKNPGQTSQNTEPETIDSIHINPMDEDGIITIDINGRVTANNFEEIQEKSLEVLQQEEVKGIVYNMNNATYVSSAGLRMFSAVHKVSRDRNKSYKLIALRQDIGKMFEMTGYASAFHIEMREE